MDEISGMLGTIGRDHSDSLSSDATQSTGNKLVLRHRLNQLVTCVDDFDPENELHEKVVKILDNAFIICSMRANKPKKERFRWRTNVISLVFSMCGGWKECLYFCTRIVLLFLISSLGSMNCSVGTLHSC